MRDETEPRMDAKEGLQVNKNSARRIRSTNKTVLQTHKKTPVRQHSARNRDD